MDWRSEVLDLYEQVVARVPDTFRTVVSVLLRETAEKKCVSRNGGRVNEADLVTALLEITPAPFQSDCVKTLGELEIDIQRYVQLKETQERHMRSWNQIGAAFHPGNYHFTMYLTDFCNHRCIHCAAEHIRERPELSADQWIEIIENLETSLRKQGRNGVYIWFGGEPTLYKDIRRLIEYCGNKRYFQAIATNGVRFDEDFASFCADNGMSHVFVSIDSIDPAKNDLIRGANHSYEFARKAIKNARNQGLFVVGNVTVMKHNFAELEKTKTTIESWGAIPYFRAVIRQRRAADNWDEIGLSPEQYRELYDFKYSLVVDRIRDGEIETLPAFAIYDMVPFMEQPRNDRELTALGWGIGCQACRTISGIDIDGSVFPCDYPSKLTLGNVLTESFEEIMNSQLFKDIRDRKRTGKCGTCHHVDLCGGGCRVHTECETGDFLGSFPLCWHDESDRQATVGASANKATFFSTNSL